MSAPYQLIPNEYKPLFSYIKDHKLVIKTERQPETMCFEKLHVEDGVELKDIFIVLV